MYDEEGDSIDQWQAKSSLATPIYSVSEWVRREREREGGREAGRGGEHL